MIYAAPLFPFFQEWNKENSDKVENIVQADKCRCSVLYTQRIGADQELLKKFGEVNDYESFKKFIEDNDVVNKVFRPVLMELGYTWNEEQQKYIKFR